MTSPTLDPRFVEAARYALLRRLAPAIRHDIAGVLQPISMMAAMLEKRLQKPAPDMQALGTSSASISAMSRQAAAECMELMTWVSPKEHKLVPLNIAVADALGLLNTEMSFRGFALVNQTGDVAVELPCSVVRSAFMAALLAMTDEAQSPAEIVMTAQPDGAWLEILLTLVPSDGEASPGSLNAYRKLQWDDAEAIAADEKVELSRSAAAVRLRYRLHS